jgi:hypothetical protein
MRYLMQSLCLLACISLMACQKNTMQLQILETHVLPQIPSASGLVYHQGLLYAIGDDSPFLFTLDANLQILSQTPIFTTEHLQGHTIAKPLKPDFEAIELVADNTLLVLGSGSKGPERNHGILIPLRDTSALKTYNLGPFYSQLKQLELLQNAELNIEATAYHNDILYLFNRGKNIIISFSYSSFLTYLENGAPLPELTIIDVTLPTLNGIEAGFSGATISPATGKLIFTASVENTPNAYDDGEVGGSFIGLADLHRLDHPDAYQFILLDTGSTPLKIESVTIVKETPGHGAELWMVSDSDGGESVLLRCLLR